MSILSDSRRVLGTPGKNESKAYGVPGSRVSMLKEEQGMTSVDNDHRHLYTIDETGTGITNYSLSHTHKIVDNVVLPEKEDGHIHTMIPDTSVVPARTNQKYNQTPDPRVNGSEEV